MLLDSNILSPSLSTPSLCPTLSLSLAISFPLSQTPSDETFGYKEFVEAAKTVKHIPVALCSDKEAWAKLSIVSDTITIFRKVNYYTTLFTLSIRNHLLDSHYNYFDNKFTRKYQLKNLISVCVLRQITTKTTFSSLRPRKWRRTALLTLSP